MIYDTHISIVWLFIGTIRSTRISQNHNMNIEFNNIILNNLFVTITLNQHDYRICTTGI